MYIQHLALVHLSVLPDLALTVVDALPYLFPELLDVDTEVAMC